MKIKLTAKTKKGRNIIQNHGDIWMKHESDNVIENNNSILLKSLNHKDLRWVKLFDDLNFSIEILE